jgi:hypothetical protein
MSYAAQVNVNTAIWLPGFVGTLLKIGLGLFGMFL